MSRLEELELNDNEVINLPDEVPEERVGAVELPQPSGNGTYTFKLPDDLSAVWIKLDTKNHGARVSASFNKDFPLTIVEDTVFDNYYRGYPVYTFINNNEYPRGREGVEVSDMYYLIKALEKNLPIDQQSVLTNNASYVKALQKHSGKLFRAVLHWEAHCNKNKNIYVTVVGEDGSPHAEEQEGTPGCGKTYRSYSRDPLLRIPKDENGLFKQRFDEFEVHGDERDCPAFLLASARLGRFAALK